MAGYNSKDDEDKKKSSSSGGGSSGSSGSASGQESQRYQGRYTNWENETKTRTDSKGNTYSYTALTSKDTITPRSNSVQYIYSNAPTTDAGIRKRQQYFGNTGSTRGSGTRGSSAYNRQQQQYNQTQPQNYQQKLAQSNATTYGLQGIEGIGQQKPDVTAQGKWYAGEQPNDIESMARIVALDGGDDLRNQLLDERYNRGSQYYRAYAGITSEAVGHLAGLGINIPEGGLTREWFDEVLPMVRGYYNPSTNSTTGAPTLKKRSSKNEKIAYWVYQAAQDLDDTDKAENEYNALKEEIGYLANSNKNYSDEEIAARIDWKKYPTLQKMDSMKGGDDGTTMQFVRHIDWDQDYLGGMIWAARNGGGTGDAFSDSVYALLGDGNSYEWKEDIAGKLTYGDDRYSPYSVGGTMDEAGMYFGVYDFDDQWFEDNAAYANSSDPTARKMYSDARKAHDFTKACREERDALYAAIDEQLGWGMDLSDKDALDDLLGGSEYRNLAKLDKSMLYGDLEDTTGPIDYRRKDVEDYIAAKMAEKEEQRLADQAAREQNSILNRTKEFFGGIGESISNFFGPKPVGEEGREPVYDSQGNEVRPEPSKANTLSQDERFNAIGWGRQMAAGSVVDSDPSSLIPRATPSPTATPSPEERPKWNREEPSASVPTPAPMQPPQAQEDIDKARRKNVADSGGVIKDFGNESDKTTWRFSTVNAQGNIAEIRRGIDDGVMTAEEGARYLNGAADAYAAENYYGATQTTREYEDLQAQVMRAEADLAGMQEPPELLTADEIESRMMYLESMLYNSDAPAQSKEQLQAEYKDLQARHDALMRSGQDMEGTPEEQRNWQNYHALMEAAASGRAQLDAMQGDYDAAQKKLAEVRKYYQYSDDLNALCGQEDKPMYRATDVLDTIMAVGRAPVPDYAPWNVYDVLAAEGESTENIRALADETKTANLKEADDIHKLIILANDAGLNIPPEEMANLQEKERQAEWNAKDTDYWMLRLEPDFENTVREFKEDLNKTKRSGFGKLFGKDKYDPIAYAAGLEDADAVAYRGPNNDEKKGYYRMEHLSDTEKDTLVYLYAKGGEEGKQAALDYYRHLADEEYGRIDSRITEDVVGAARDFASQGGLQAGVATLGSILISPFNSVSSFDIMADRLLHRRHNPRSQFGAIMQASQEVRGIAKEDLQSLAGGPDSIGGKLLGTTFDAFVSAGDSFMNSAFVGATGLDSLVPGSGKIAGALNSGIGSANMALSAFSSTYNDVLTRGGNEDQALAMGLVSFLAEDLTEAIELSDILGAVGIGAAEGPAAKTFKQFIIQQLPELTNETFGEALGQYVEGISDDAIMGALSNRNQNIQNYVAALKEADSELTDEAALAEATQYADGDFWSEVMYSGVLGGFSAGMSTTAGYVTGRIERVAAIHNRTKELQRSLGVSKDKAREIATYEVTGEVDASNAETATETPAELATPTQPEMPAAPAAVRNAEAMGIQPGEYMPRTSTQMANDLANEQKRGEEPVSPARADTSELTDEEIEAAPDETIDVVESGSTPETQPEINPIEAMETVNRGPAPLAPIQGPLQETVAEPEPSPYRLGVRQPKATLRVLPKQYADRLGRTFVSLSDARGASPQVQGIALAAALDVEQADAFTTGEAMAASQGLAETLGGDAAIDLMQDALITAAKTGMDEAAVKGAIRTAALVEGESRDIIQQMRDTTLTPEKLTALVEAAARDLQDPNKGQAIVKRVMDAQVSQRTQEIVADGGLESVKPYESKVKKTRRKLRRAVAGLETAEANVEAAQENFRAASENLLENADGRSDAGTFTGDPERQRSSLNQLENAVTEQQRAEQEQAAAEAENAEAEKAYNDESTKALNQIRAQAMEDVSAERQRAEQIRQQKLEQRAAREEATRQEKQAVSDAGKLDPRTLGIYDAEAGGIGSAGNNLFVRAFFNNVGGKSRGTYVNADGSVNESGITRIRNALFQAAFGDQSLVSTLAKSTDQAVQNITTALTNAAPKIAFNKGVAESRERQDLGVSNIIAQAADMFRSLRESGQTVAEWMNTAKVEDNIPTAVQAVMDMFERHADNPGAVSKILNDIAARSTRIMQGTESLMNGGEIGQDIEASIVDSINASEQNLQNPATEQTAQFDADTIQNTADSMADEYIERYGITDEADQQAVRDQARAVMEDRAARENESALDTDAMRTQRAEIIATNKEQARRIGERIGMRIEYVDNVPYNGRIVTNADGTATIQINNALAADGNGAFQRVLLHELTHYTEQTGLYGELQNFLLYRAYGTNSTLLDMDRKKGTPSTADQNLLRDVQARMDLYNSRGIPLDFNGALQEITADLTYDMLYGENEDLIYSLATEKPGLIQNIIQHISELIGKLTGHGNVDELQRMRDKFQKALDQAGKSRGQQSTQYMIVDQQKVNDYITHAIEYRNNPETIERQEPLLDYAKVSDRLIDDLKDDIDLTGYVHALRDNDLRHILNSHGEGTPEKNPVTETDLQRIPEIVQDYDDVYYVDHNGRTGIYYTKTYEDEGTTYYLEGIGEYNSKKIKRLTNHQMLKLPAGEIPNIKALKDAIQKKKSRTPSTDDAANAVPRTYVQDVWSPAHSEQSVSQPNQPVNSQQKYSLPEIKTEDGEDAIEQVPGAVAKYSFSSWTADEQARVTQALINTGEFTPEEVQKWISDVNSIAAMIGADRTRLDYKAAANQKFLKDNAEYVKTLDSSTLCAKRRLYQGTFDAIQKLLPNTVISSDLLIHLRNMMAERGYETPCGICYVESRRRNLGAFTDRFLKNYGGDSTGYKPTMADLTTTDGLEALRTEHPEAYEAYRAAMAKTGSNNPKVVQPRTDYRGEIMQLTPGQVQKIIEIGGLRVQSFSDFETPHLIDMMQAVLDMAAKGLTSQAYTKVPNFAAVFGGTGIKINLSLIAEGTGLDENSNLVYSSYEGMDIKRALELRDQYADNVGTILVGVSDAHILAAMASDDIDFIIPFHKSGWGKKQLEQLTAMRGYHDYTADQNERRVVGKTATGKPKIKKVDENFHPVDYWDYSKSGKENAETYLRMCAEDGRIPKFARFLVNNGDGSYSLQPDGSTDGYWKLLGDFKMYNHLTGEGTPQRAVTPNFNMEEAQRVLNDYEGGADTLPVAQDVVKDFVEEYKGEHPRAKYSLPANMSEELGLMAEQRIRERQENTAAREQAALEARAVNEAARKVRLYEQKRGGNKLTKEGIFSNLWDDTNPLEKVTNELMRQNTEEIKRLKARQAAGETLTEEEQALIRAGARGGIRATQDPREMVRHKRNVVNNYMTACLEDGMVNTQGERVRKADGTTYGSLNDITNGRVEMHEEQEFNQFLFDVYSLERDAWGKPITDEKAESIQRRLAATMARHGDWMQVADDIADWYGTFVHEWVVKPGGLMSEEAYQAMRTAYPHYIPMLGTGEDLVLPRALQHEQSERQRVARLKRAGMSKGNEVMNPMYALVSQMQKYMETEKQAEVMRAADAAFSNNGIQALGWAELVEEPAKPAPKEGQTPAKDPAQAMEAESNFQWVTLDDDGDSVLHVPMPDGTVRHWKCYDMGMVDALTRDQAGNRLMNAINNTPVVGEVVRFLSSLTRFLCANSTSRDIRFSGQNFISDGHTAMITGNTAGNLLTYNLERLGTLAWLMNQHRIEKHGGEIDEQYRQYKLQGNMGSAFRLRDEITQRSIRKGMYGKDTTREGRRATNAQHWQEVGTIGGLFEIISKTLNIVPGRISKLSDLLEETTRVNEWLKGGHDLSTYDGRIAAARASREATTDFSLSGSNEALALYGKFVPFARAQMQGVYKTVQTLTGNDSAAKSKVMRRLVFNTLASAIVGGILREISWDDDEKEAYEEMSAYEKMKYYHLKLPGIGILKLKRSQDSLIQFANGVGETIADLCNGYEDNDFGQLWDYGMDIASNMLPSRDFIFNPFIDAANNRTWYGGAIESAKLSGRAETDKYEADTLGIFRGMSQFCNAVPGLPNYSPLDCEYIFQQYLGSAGRIMVGEFQNVVSEDGFTAQDLLMTAWDQIGGKLTYDPVYSSYASNTFYEGMDQLSAVIDMDKAGAFECGYLRKLNQAEFKGAAREAKKLQDGTLGSIRKQISKLWKAYNSVSDNKNMPRAEKDASLRTIRDSINRLSVQGNSIIAEYMRKYGRRSIRQTIADGVLDLID